MKKLYDTYYEYLKTVDTHFVRYLYDRIPWDDPLVLILGTRGVGKTTMMLQHILLTHEEDTSLYVSADNPFLSTTSLIELAEYFCNHGGKYLYIDEVHKYPGWAREIKTIYDIYHTRLNIKLSGSSMIDIIRGIEVDLSRRCLPFVLEPMSFREYLNYSLGTDIKPFTLDEILAGKVKLPKNVEYPLQMFGQYLRIGNYPFFKERDFLRRIDIVVSQTLDVDIPQQINASMATVRKLKKLMQVLAQSTPFKPNLSNLGRTLEMDRSSVGDMLYHLEKAGLLRQLREDEDIMDRLTKVEKVYLNNPNLCYSLCDEEPDKGTLRETFFFSQMAVNHKVVASPVSDFIVDGHTFEVGGKNKKRKQIANLDDSYVVKDDIMYAYQNIIPLWMFGLNY